MNGHEFTLNDVALTALPSGALWWPEMCLLCVSDLHLGKSERVARKGGVALPPYETEDTLKRLAADLELTNARQVICLGDSFDDLGAAFALNDEARFEISRLQTGRRWVWIEGNHDPGPVEFGGEHLVELALGELVFRHIAETNATCEISGHYHPKAHVRTRAKTVTRACFLVDSNRIILPAYGTYTGGLASHSPVFAPLFKDDAIAILTGRRAFAVPMPRQTSAAA